MRRRNFIAGVASMTAVALPMVMSAADVRAANWRRIADETNTFGPDDTLEIRLRKFNELTGIDLTLSDPCGHRYKKVIMAGKHGKPIRTEDQSTWRCFVYPDGSSTGSMDEETMMHWTAQVALGYRLAKAQAG